MARYYRTHSFLPKAAEIAQRTYIFDNTVTPQLGAVVANGEIVQQNDNSPQWIKDTLKVLGDRDRERNFLRTQFGQKTLLPTNINEARYTGTISSVGEHYVVQQISTTEIVLHDLCLIDSALPVSQTFTIEYRDGVSSFAIAE